MPLGEVLAEQPVGVSLDPRRQGERRVAEVDPGRRWRSRLLWRPFRCPVPGQRAAQILEAGVPDDAPGCSAAIAVDGEVVWAEARGLANLETGAEFETSTPIHIASTGKQFTAMAVLMLAERGDLSLDESPAVYLDGSAGMGRTPDAERPDAPHLWDQRRGVTAREHLRARRR